MSRPFTTELKVGLFVVAATIILIVGYVMASEGLRAGEDAYRVTVVVPTAEGLYEGTPVKLAGVEIGVVDDIAISGNNAVLRLAIRGEYELPVDSRVEVKSSGLLGDKHVGIELGRAEAIVADGGVLAFGAQPGDLDVITRQIESISYDVKEITSEIRDIVRDPENRRNFEQTLANVEALSAELRLIAEENRRDIAAIVDSVRRLSESLESFVAEARDDVSLEMDKLHRATDTLDRALLDIESITTKIDEGEGTLGALVNDDETIVLLNETLAEAKSVIESFSNLHAEVYYVGRLYVGTQPPTDPFFFGNPVAPNLGGGLGFSGSNTIGVELHPQEDFWWIFEINDYPVGSIAAQQHYFPDQEVAWLEYTRRLDFRFTFMMSKRWHNLALRLGIKESGGGVGASYYLANDRVMLMVDAFDFTFGSFPAVDDKGLPNLRLSARFEPVDHLFLEAGAEQVLLGLKYGYATGYVGGGFHFTDDDIKILLATLPLPL